MQKYKNKLNGLIYSKVEGVYYVERDGVKIKSAMDDSTFNEMIEAGEMTPINHSRDDFKAAFERQLKDMPGYNARFVAFVAWVGFSEAYAGTVAHRNSRFMAWISDRKADFVKAHGEHVKKDYCTGTYTITAGDKFTDFITSGEWIE